MQEDSFKLKRPLVPSSGLLFNQVGLNNVVHISASLLAPPVGESATWCAFREARGPAAIMTTGNGAWAGHRVPPHTLDGEDVPFLELLVLSSHPVGIGHIWRWT